MNSEVVMPNWLATAWAKLSRNLPLNQEYVLLWQTNTVCIVKSKHLLCACQVERNTLFCFSNVLLFCSYIRTEQQKLWLGWIQILSVISYMIAYSTHSIQHTYIRMHVTITILLLLIILHFYAWFQWPIINNITRG